MELNAIWSCDRSVVAPRESWREGVAGRLWYAACEVDAISMSIVVGTGKELDI